MVKFAESFRFYLGAEKIINKYPRVSDAGKVFISETLSNVGVKAEEEASKDAGRVFERRAFLACYGES